MFIIHHVLNSEHISKSNNSSSYVKRKKSADQEVNVSFFFVTMPVGEDERANYSQKNSVGHRYSDRFSLSSFFQIAWQTSGSRLTLTSQRCSHLCYFNLPRATWTKCVPTLVDRSFANSGDNRSIFHYHIHRCSLWTIFTISILRDNYMLWELHYRTNLRVYMYFHLEFHAT